MDDNVHCCGGASDDYKEAPVKWDRSPSLHVAACVTKQMSRTQECHRTSGKQLKQTGTV